MTDEQIDKLLAAFKCGLVTEPDTANPRGFTVRYKPRDAMRAALADTNVIPVMQGSAEA